MSIKQYIRRNIYRWHRTSSIIIAVPVMLWALSGFMHPIMTNIRPKVATQGMPEVVLDSSFLQMPLQTALQQNHVTVIQKFRVVHIGENHFYQVKLPGEPVLRYFSAKDGKEMLNGDALYARYLAQSFLQGEGDKNEKQESCCTKGETRQEHLRHLQASMTAMSVLPVSESRDCCAQATEAVMRSAPGSKVNKVEMLTAFTDEYKYINRLLPAYKVSFDRSDGIRIYVETGSDRFAFAVDNKRAAFDKFFSIFHTWSWMDALGNTKYVLMLLITTLALFTTAMGLYIFFTTKSKKAVNAVAKNRRLHRVTALTASLFTLLFAFSGGYHALAKMKSEEQTKVLTFPVQTEGIHLHFAKIQSLFPAGQITNISLAEIEHLPYYQVFLKSGEENSDGGKKDLMKSMQVTPQRVAYVNMADYSLLQDGETLYAKELACGYSGLDQNKVKATGLITKFSDEYAFINKRLPVWKVSYAGEGNQRYYVETSSGALASKVKDQDLYEGYSFALLHKHHFMDWGGKGVRDTSTMIAAALVLLASLVGLFLWLRLLKKA